MDAALHDLHLSLKKKVSALFEKAAADIFNEIKAES